MRTMLIPAAAAAVLLACTPGQTERRSGGEGDGGAETGMSGGDGAGGFSVHDTASTGTPAGTGTPPRVPSGMLSQLHVVNRAEIGASRLAAERARSPDVKAMARTLAADHAKNQDRLEALAAEIQVDLVPAAGGAAVPEAADSATLSRLEGAEFDRQFLRQQIEAHRSNLDAIENQMLPAVQDEQVRRFLEETLAAMQGHLDSLEAIQGRVTS